MGTKLKAMLASAGIFLLGGIGYFVSTPQPATRSMLELKDAGILDGQRLVFICPERLTKQTARRIEAKQPGLLRPKQAYARIARSARCFNPDGGNCLRPSDGLARVSSLEGELIIPSLRMDLSGVDLDASVGADDGGDNDDVDDSFQYRSDACTLLTCTQFDDGVTAGTYLSPYVNGCLGGLNRLALQPLPNMIPDCRGPDGGWDDNAGEAGHIAAPDCRFSGPYGLPDGGPRWAGCNSLPREFAGGSACLPVESSVLMGDLISQEWL